MKFTETIGDLRRRQIAGKINKDLQSPLVHGGGLDAVAGMGGRHLHRAKTGHAAHWKILWRKGPRLKTL